MDSSKLKRLENIARERVSQVEVKDIPTIIIGPSSRRAIYSDGSLKILSENEAAVMRSEGKVGQVIICVSDSGAEMTGWVCQGKMPGERNVSYE